MVVCRCRKITGLGNVPSLEFCAICEIAHLCILSDSTRSPAKNSLEILVNPDSFNKELLSKINILKEPYKRPFYLSNCHLETIFASYYRFLPKLTYYRECLKMPDGGTVAVDWPINGDDGEVWRGQLEQDMPVLILLVCAFFILSSLSWLWKGKTL